MAVDRLGEVWVMHVPYAVLWHQWCRNVLDAVRCCQLGCEIGLAIPYTQNLNGFRENDTIRKLLMKAACVAMDLTHLTVAYSGYCGRCAQNRTSTIPTPTPYPIPNPNPATNPNPSNLTPSPTLTLTLILTLPKYDRLCRNVSNGVRWCPMVSDGF